MNYMECSVVIMVMMLSIAGAMLVNDFIHRRMKNSTLKFILVVFITGVVSSFFPFFTWGFMLGLPSVIMNTALLTIFYRNRL
jgi:hypothetical protein